jgi:hypothetical protein
MQIKSIVAGAMLLQSLIVSGDEMNSLAIFPRFPVQGQTVEIMITLPEEMAREAGEVNAKVTFKQRDRLFAPKTETFKRQQESLDFKALWQPPANGRGNLEVDLAMPDGNKLKMTLELTVLAKPLFMPWWIGEKELNDRVTNLTHVLSKPEDGNYWRKRGVVPCVWKGTKFNDAEKYAEYLGQNLPSGFGILIDELGYYEFSAEKREIIKGIKLFKESRPDVPVYVYVCGSLKPETCMLVQNAYRKSGCDKLMLEAYHDYQVPEFNAYLQNKYFDQRLDMARDYDILQNCIMILGTVGTQGYVLTPALMEQQFRYVRMNAPEVTGIGFYKAIHPDLTAAVNELCRKYFIAPVLTSWDKDIITSDTDLRLNQETQVEVKIYNLGATDAGPIKVRLSTRDPNGAQTIPVAEQQLSEVLVKEGVPSGSTTLKFNWVPTHAGYLELIVEILPEDSESTVLNGRTSRTVYIQGK